MSNKISIAVSSMRKIREVDRPLIKIFRQQKMWRSWRLLKEFSRENWIKTSGWNK